MLASESGQMILCWVCHDSQACDISCLCSDLSEELYELGWSNSPESFAEEDCDLSQPLNLSIMELDHVSATSEMVPMSNFNRQYLLHIKWF